MRRSPCPLKAGKPVFNNFESLSTMPLDIKYSAANAAQSLFPKTAEADSFILLWVQCLFDAKDRAANAAQSSLALAFPPESASLIGTRNTTNTPVPRNAGTTTPVPRNAGTNTTNTTTTKKTSCRCHQDPNGPEIHQL